MAKAKTPQDLANELAQLNQPTDLPAEPQPENPEDAVTAQNIEDSQTEDPTDLLAENEALKAYIAQLEASQPQEPELDPDAELYYDGIIHPDYRLKSVYVPFNAKGVSKQNGFDHELGESYVYTAVKLAHLPPGSEHHRMETFNVRLDNRVVVPQFVASALGDRADVQDYFG